MLAAYSTPPLVAPDFGALGDSSDDPDMRPDRWTVRTVLDRLTSRGDPFRVLLGVEQELPDLR